MPFETLTNEQIGLGGGHGGGGPFVAPKLGGSDRDMFYHKEKDPPMGGPTGFSMDEWNRLRDLLYLTGHPYFKLNSAHPLEHVSPPARSPTRRCHCARGVRARKAMRNGGLPTRCTCLGRT